MADKDDLRAVLERAFDEIQHRAGQSPEPPPDIDTARRKEALISEFVRICRSQPKTVKIWLVELMGMKERVTTGRVEHPSLPLVYLGFLEALSQHPGVDLGDTSRVRGLLLPRKEDHLARGLKVLRAAKDGHAAQHGTPEQKERRWQEWQTAIDKLRGQYPSYSHNKLCEIASLDLGVPVSTLRLRTR
jgi:hypothetical protein